MVIQGNAQSTAAPAMGLLPYLVAGVVIILGFFGGFVGWAAYAPLDGAAIAAGAVKVDSNRKAIQHLEGGIVAKILVRDGDVVAAGDVLVALDETRSKAALELYAGRKAGLAALEARLIAQRDGLASINFPPWLRDAAERSDVAKAMQVQRDTFHNTVAAFKGQSDVLAQQVAQSREEIRGLRGQVAAEQRELAIVNDELKVLYDLLKDGLAQKPRVRQMERDAARLEGSIGQHKSRVALIEQRISELRLKATGLKEDYRDRALRELQQAQAQISDVIEQERSAGDVLKRTKIFAPIAGTIVNSQVHTAGGIIAPGATIMEVVPVDDDLIIEARLDPRDIDVVHAGLSARVRFTAFSQRNLQPVDGTVAQVSADSLIDEQTGDAYFVARITIERGYKAKLQGAALHPGMQAEVMISTGERTALDYFLKPIEDSFRRAMTES